MAEQSYRVYEGENELTKHLLNRYELEDFTTGTRMAFVDSFSENITKTDKPFFKFNLRDVNGTIVQARLFNVDVDENTSNTLRKLNKKVVRVIYLVTSFNNELHLSIESIDLAPEQYQNMEKYFLGEVEGIDELPNKILHEVARNMDITEPNYKYISSLKQNMLLHKIKGRSLEAYSWKLGSGLLHIYNTLMSIEGTPLDEVTKETTRTLYLVSETFINNERELEDTDLGEGFMNNIKVLEALTDSVIKSDNENSDYHKKFKKEVMHIVQVRLGMAQPNTLSAHVIQLADKLTRTTANLNELHKGMGYNSARHTSHGKLVRL